MQRLIAWLLKRYTPFRVLAWDRGKIAGIGYSMVEYGGARRVGHSALRFNRETGKLDMFDPHPSSKPWPLDRRSRMR